MKFKPNMLLREVFAQETNNQPTNDMSYDSTMKIVKSSIRYLAVFRTGKSQYSGDCDYQIEATINGVRLVEHEQGRTVREVKDKFEWRQHLKSRNASKKSNNANH